MECVKRQRATFRDGIKDKRFDKTAEFDPQNLELFKTAVLLGYNDTKRTLTNIGAFWKDKQEQKECLFNALAERIRNLFTCQCAKTWHEDLCEFFCENLRKLGYTNINYGQAQKVINMAFKYLFCYDGAEAYKSVFEKCHMPLDSYTLAWYRKLPKAKDEKAHIRYDTKWSNLEEAQYKAIQVHILTCLKKGCQIVTNNTVSDLPEQPFYAEFIIWPEEILLQAGNAFMKTLDADHKKITSDSGLLFKQILCEKLPQFCNLKVKIEEETIA